MAKLSILVLMLCTLSIIVNVTGKPRYRHYENEEEGDITEEIRELTEKFAKENKLTQEEVYKLREEVKSITQNEHKMTQEEISKLREEVNRLKAEEEHHQLNWKGHHHSGGLLGSLFQLKKQMLEKHFHHGGKW